MRICILNNGNPDVSEAIHEIMQESYKQEARLLGLEHFPPLDRTANDIAKDKSIYYGAFLDECLAGVLHFNLGNIDSLVVKPCFQRLGIATSLLCRLFIDVKGSSVTVSTAQRNTAAVSLYQKLGFSVASTHLKSGIQLITYAKD